MTVNDLIHKLNAMVEENPNVGKLDVAYDDSEIDLQVIESDEVVPVSEANPYKERSYLCLNARKDDEGCLWSNRLRAVEFSKKGTEEHWMAFAKDLVEGRLQILVGQLREELAGCLLDERTKQIINIRKQEAYEEFKKQESLYWRFEKARKVYGQEAVDAIRYYVKELFDKAILIETSKDRRS